MTPETLRQRLVELEQTLIGMRDSETAGDAQEQAWHERAECVHHTIALLAAQPSDAGEREAFMAGWDAFHRETQFNPSIGIALTSQEAYAAWKASQQPPAPREQEHKA